MKRSTTGLLLPLSEESVTNLTKEVKEVLVAGYKKNQEQILSIADLWNIHRQRKVRMQRRYM
ncbi:MAG: hypothetical protein ABI685_13895 [Ferruginibacter sp.]